MATIDLQDDHVHVMFTAFERLAGLVRNQRVLLASIDDVTVEPSGARAVTGWRFPGLAVPGRTKIGTWRRPGERMLVRVRPGQPAVRLDVHDHRYARFIIGDGHAATTAERLQAAMNRR